MGIYSLDRCSGWMSSEKVLNCPRAKHPPTETLHRGQGVSQGVPSDRSEVNGRIKQARDEFLQGCP